MSEVRVDPTNGKIYENGVEITFEQLCQTTPYKPIGRETVDKHGQQVEAYDLASSYPLVNAYCAYHECEDLSRLDDLAEGISLAWQKLKPAQPGRPAVTLERTARGCSRDASGKLLAETNPIRITFRNHNVSEPS